MTDCGNALDEGDAVYGQLHGTSVTPVTVFDAGIQKRRVVIIDRCVSQSVALTWLPKRARAHQTHEHMPNGWADGMFSDFMVRP